VASLIVFFVFFGLFFLYLRIRHAPVTIKGLLQATGFVLGLLFIYIFATLMGEELDIDNLGDTIISGIIFLIIILRAIKYISGCLPKGPEIQLDVFITFREK